MDERPRGCFGDNEQIRETADARSDLVDLDVVLHHETPARGVNPGAVLVSIDGMESRAAWLPKSLVEITRNRGEAVATRKNGQREARPLVRITLQEKIAKQKELL